MASLNKVQIIGHLGRDPETRYLPSGEAVTNINVATTDRYKDKGTGEMREATEWHRVGFFGKLAEIAGQYLRKGSQVYVEGSLRTRKWTDKEGIERYATEIRAESMQMLGARQSGEGGGQQARPAANSRPAAEAPRNPPDASHASGGGEGGYPSTGFDESDDIPFVSAHLHPSADRVSDSKAKRLGRTDF